MGYMFARSKFNGDISKWNVSSVRNMQGMFAESAFTGDLSNWDMSKVVRIRGMFYDAKFCGDISNWDLSMAYIKSRDELFSNNSLSRVELKISRYGDGKKILWR